MRAGLARKSVNSCSGFFSKRVSCHRSGVRKSYVDCSAANVACKEHRAGFKLCAASWTSAQ